LAASSAFGSATIVEICWHSKMHCQMVILESFHAHNRSHALNNFESEIVRDTH
jgi:hypothetical protein